jgi:thiamine-phosphate pyrophosphorylase
LNHKKLELYFIMGTPNVRGQSPLLVLEEALKGGVTCFQLCEKGPDALTGAELKAFAVRCKELCQAFSVPFIIHDDVELAVEIDADGVHIGQHVDASVVRGIIGPNRLLGITTHTLQQAFAAADVGADYIFVGPVFGTKMKSTSHRIVGPGVIREITSLLPGLPIVGFGGITERKIDAVITAGASGIAVFSAITRDGLPETSARRLKGRVLLSLTGVEM